MVKKIDRKNKFISVFNPENGFYVRTGVIDNDGNDTGVDPFMSSYPELIDVGVMGHCIHGKSGLCFKSGVQCYQNGLKTYEPNMTLEQFKTIVNQCKGKTYQLALGGRGDVNKHEQFRDIVAYCRENNIVPNYTTSGLELTDEEVQITKEFCGAVAVSWYRQEHTYRAIQMFLDAQIKTNIHYVLGNNSIDEAIDKLNNNNFPKGINAVIFLLHKPVGLGKEDNVLDVNDLKVKEFYNLIDTKQFDFKVGFDSCNIPGLINFTSNLNPDSFDTCEAARWSAYITSDMKMLPCSFDNQDLKWVVDLNTNIIQQAWDSEQFENFRSHYKKSCGGCKDRLSCLGGCPIKRQIVLCNKREKDLYEN
jgi:radical SAM protein with 4Fe4S-binding SPASM domain